jgi:FtsH-binding integral membrane protein
MYESHASDGSSPPREPEALSVLRRILLAVLLVGIAGLTAELLLLEHYEDVWQWTPLALLAAGLVAGAAVALRPGRGVLLAFRAVMALYIVAGALGAYLHLQGNAEFERESDPAITGTALLWASLRGATPALAPGALAQLGLLGLALAYRHPALRRTKN